MSKDLFGDVVGATADAWAAVISAAVLAGLDSAICRHSRMVIRLSLRKTTLGHPMGAIDEGQ